MAVRTVSNTGGNWDTATTWVEGIVPTSIDNVVFTATSGNLTVNVASLCNGINFTNYPSGKTITFNNSLSLYGASINLGAGLYTQAGTSGIILIANTGTTGLTSNGVIWSRTFTFSGGGGGAIYTLNDDWNFTNNISFTNSNTCTINGFNIYTNGLTSTTAQPTTGTTNIIFNGTGTWSHSSTGAIQNNITINTAGIITLGTNIYYNTGTLTYTAGTVNTTTNNSTLNIGASTILDTDRGATQIDWNNVITSGTTTITLLSNLNITNLTVSSSSTLSFVSGGNILSVSNNLTTGIQATFNTPNNLQVTNLILGTGGNGNININGLFTISVSGNLTQNHGSLITTGTTNITLNGTGTWSNPSTGVLRNNLTIDTLGTLTVSGNVYYHTGTLTYTAGTVDTTGSTLNIALATTFNTSGMTWNNVTITSGIQTLTSDLNCQNLTNSSVTINGLFNINVSGNLTANGITLIGTATIVLMGTGTWTANNGSNTFRIPVIINTNGIITLPNSLYHESSLTYIKGTVKSNNTTITFGGGTTTTLVNLHKLIFRNVIIGAGTTITMNEFFSGSPSLVTNITSTSTSNYTIAFQDGFEKIAKFVNISNCTLSKPLQLLVLTKSKRNSTNRGIRYINQSPNGIAKGEPSVNQTTFGPGGLLPDPIKL